MHRVIVPQLGPVPERLTIGGDEGRHAAAVKRLRQGEAVELLDGRGGVAAATVLDLSAGTKRSPASIVVETLAVRRVAPVLPRVHVFAPAPKGDRLAWMVDQLTQAGAASWTPLRTARSVPEPGAARRERLERIAAEALKQCGRAWALQIGEECDLAGAITRTDLGPIIYGDATGDIPVSLAPADCFRLMVGPEGGLSDAEAAALRQAGATPARFGPHVMRIETAALAGVLALVARAAQ